MLYKPGILPGGRSAWKNITDVKSSPSVADYVSKARTTHSVANTPPPGFGDPVGSREYGDIPNHGAMRREIDAMMAPSMPFTQAPGEGVPSIPQTNPYAPGGSRHVPWMDGPDSYADIGIGRSRFPSWSPEVSQGFNPNNPYSWVGVPGGGSVVPPGTEDFLTSTDWISGITPPSAQTFPSAASHIPDPEFGAVNEYSPATVKTPFVGAGDPLLSDTTTQYDFMAAMDPATGAMAPGGAGAAWTPTGYDVMAGMDPATGPMAYGANPDPYGPLGDRYVPWQSGSPNEQTDVGIGAYTDGYIEDDNPDFRGPPSSAPSAWPTDDPAPQLGMNQLGIGGYRTEDGQVGSTAPETAVANYEAEQKLTKDLAEQRIAEHEARFGAMKAEEKKRQEEYLDDLAKIQKKQRMFMVLGALSGDPNLARIAGTIAQQDMAVLNQKYEWASGDRTAQMQQALMYNANGEYDPPESRQELYSALSTMGADSTEMDWFDTQFFGSARSADNTYRNFINTRTGDTYSGYGPPDESGAWAITGQYDYGTKDGKTPGGVDMEKYQIWQEAKRANEEGTMSDEELGDLKKALGLSDRGITLNQEYSMFESMYKGEHGRWRIVGPDGKKISKPTAKQVQDAFKKFQTEVMPTLEGVTPDATGSGDEDKVSIKKAIEILDNDPSPDNIKYFIETYGEDKLPSKYK